MADELFDIMIKNLLHRPQAPDPIIYQGADEKQRMEEGMKIGMMPMAPGAGVYDIRKPPKWWGPEYKIPDAKIDAKDALAFSFNNVPANTIWSRLNGVLSDHGITKMDMLKKLFTEFPKTSREVR